MLRSDTVGSYAYWSVGKYDTGTWGLGTWGSGTWGGEGISTDYIFDETTLIPIPTGGVWKWYEFDITDTDWRYFGIITDTANSANVYIDRVQLYMYDRSSYDAPVVKVSIKLSPDNDRLCDLELNQYDLQANDVLFQYERKVDKLEAMNQSS